MSLEPLEVLTTLYFAYTAMISPDRIGEVAPGAEFRFIAHLPETKLIFPFEDSEWQGGLPSVIAEPGNTVWGAVFDLPEPARKAIDSVEETEGRVANRDFRAVDREGHRHAVLTHVHNGAAGGEFTPSRDYMALVVEGGRHWGLPTGWVAGLEEYVEEPLL
ncbi:MAG: gamma-glutamylcyclotransferase [Acidimicrobiia bacterium]